MIKSILNENNIVQICISDNIKVNKLNFKEYKKYNVKSRDTFFIGVCNSNDIKIISAHKGKKILFWDVTKCSSDEKNLLKSNIDSNNNFLNNVILNLCDNIETYDFLNNNNMTNNKLLTDERTISIESESESINDNNSEYSKYSSIEEKNFFIAFNEKKKRYSNITSYEDFIKKQEGSNNKLFGEFLKKYNQYSEKNKFDEKGYNEYINSQDSTSILDEDLSFESNNEISQTSDEDALNINYEEEDQVKILNK